jgi:hypothetical protein
MHEVVLLGEQNKSLRAANETLSTRRRAKKTHVRQGGALTVGDSQDFLAQKDIDRQVAQEMRQNGGRPRLRRAFGAVAIAGRQAIM